MSCKNLEIFRLLMLNYTASATAFVTSKKGSFLMVAAYLNLFISNGFDVCHRSENLLLAGFLEKFDFIRYLILVYYQSEIGSTLL